jgi:hypothetical protein
VIAPDGSGNTKISVNIRSVAAPETFCPSGPEKGAGASCRCERSLLNLRNAPYFSNETDTVQREAGTGFIAKHYKKRVPENKIGFGG